MSMIKTLSVFVLLAFCVAATAAGRPNYPEEPNAAEIIRDKCKKEWPDDFQMRNYCEDRQWEGLEKLYGRGGNSR